MAKLPSAGDMVGGRPALTVVGGINAAQPPAPGGGGRDPEFVAQQVLARSLANAGQDIATATLRERDRYEDMRVEDAFNQLREQQLDLTMGQQNGFANQKGANAVNKPLLKEWGDKFDEKAKSIGESLSDDRQRERFQQRAAIAKSAYVGDIMRHVSHENGVYQAGVYKSTLDLETRAAMAQWGDSDAIGLSLERVQNAVRSEADRLGFAEKDPQRLAMQLHAQSSIHAGVISQALESQNPIYAQKYYEANKGSIDPAVVKQLGHQVAEGVQKQLANDYQGQYVAARNDEKTLKVLEDKVEKDQTLDETRRNALLGRIGTRVDRLVIQRQHEEDRRTKLVQRQIDGVNKLTLAGYEPTTEQMMTVVNAARGTGLEGEVQLMIATANATRSFRIASPQSQEATITALETAARKDPTKFDVTVIDRFKKIYSNQQEQLKQDPTTFGIRQGLVDAESVAAKPLDLGSPENMTEQLQARFTLGRSMRATHQAPFKPLTKEEADTLVSVLKTMPVEQKSTYFSKLANASAGDFDGYKALMAQIAPDDPVTAHAGVMAGRGRMVTDAGFQPEPGKATNVSALILRGQSILQPNRKEDGSPEKGKLWPMPPDLDMAKTWQAYERDAFAGKPEARNGMLQTARAIYAARSAEAGDASGVLDSGRWQEAMKLATGGVERWNGKSIVMPWGYSRGQFKDELRRRLEDVEDSGQLPQGTTASKLYDMPLESIGDGRYMLRAGDGILVTQPKGTKAQIKNADGSVSTERTITIEADGRHFIVPTIVDGKQLTEKSAIDAWKKGTNKAVGEFGTAQEAEAAARARTARLSEELRPRPIIIDFNQSPAFRPSGYKR